MSSAGQTLGDDRDVAQGGHDLRCRAGPNLEVVLAAGDIANPVQAVVDLAVLKRQAAPVEPGRGRR
jgi:hypothetical protein